MLFTEGKPQEAIVVILIVFVSEIVGWVLKNINISAETRCRLCHCRCIVFSVHDCYPYCISEHVPWG